MTQSYHISHVDQEGRSSHDEYSWSTIVTHPSSDECEAHCHHPVVDPGIDERSGDDTDDPDSDLPWEYLFRQSSEECSRRDYHEQDDAHDLIEDAIAIEAIDTESDQESYDSEMEFRFVWSIITDQEEKEWECYPADYSEPDNVRKDKKSDMVDDHCDECEYFDIVIEIWSGHYWDYTL